MIVISQGATVKSWLFITDIDECADPTTCNPTGYKLVACLNSIGSYSCVSMFSGILTQKNVKNLLQYDASLLGLDQPQAAALTSNIHSPKEDIRNSIVVSSEGSYYVK